MCPLRPIKRDFEKPSLLWRFEDVLKNLFGEWFNYSSYVSKFKLEGSKKVLDFGCGGGIGSRRIAKRLSKEGHLTCVDISNFWISKAKKRLKNYENVEFIVGEITALDIPDSYYDIISIFYVLHDIPPSRRKEMINCLSKKLNEGGRLYISEPTKRSHGMTSEEIYRLMSQAGFIEKTYRKKKSSYTGGFYKNPKGHRSYGRKVT